MSTQDHVGGPPVWAPLEKLQALLERRAEEHPDIMSLEEPGRSLEGRPVYAVRLTDPNADDEDKEHVLMTTLHSGGERSATSMVFYMIEWFLSNDPAAREILKRQVVVCMPVSNPDAYVAGTHGGTYSEWDLNGPSNPDKMPEAVAVQKMMDELQPEVHADVHGLSMDFERYIMLENSASSYSNLSLRCFHREIIRQMDDAALAEGYPSDRQESDAERIFWGPEMEALPHKLWVGRPQVYAATYCYNLYHSLMSASEVSWERSGFLRHRRLLEIGNERWPGEYYPGYPVRVVATNNYHQVTPYGLTAAARRRSRVELWNRVGQITVGMADPMMEGKIVYVVATSDEASKRWLSEKSLNGFADNLSECPETDDEAIRSFVAGWPGGQNAPQAVLALAGGGEIEDAGPLENGLSIRLRIPYSKCLVSDLRLNGYPLPPSESDGFVEWVARGYKYVQINVPPEKAKAQDLFVVTCEYDPQEKRERWQGWK
ncbi:MAG: M14 family zinc carboxypeptidase [Planctomycetota bacterium]|nr:M14 family zinc carboxypeptidase [Planctomycetota bacterium]